MSLRDYNQYKDLIPKIIGRKCFLSGAMNSLKLHIDEDKKDGIFIWVDPPWVFGTTEAKITSSYAYPDLSDTNYKSMHEEWVSILSPIKETVFEEIEAKPDGSLFIRFGHNYILYAKHVDGLEDRDPESWYDHWYIRIED